MFAIATDPAPGRPNEDAVAATADLAVVVDGAGIAFGGCTHGVAWYAQQLATQTLAALVATSGLPLSDGLAAGLAATAELHADTCDLTHPGTPCASVGILRVGPEAVDALALSDVFVVVETDAGPQVTVDLAIEELNGTEPGALAGLVLGTPEHAAALARLVEAQTVTRNRPDGWWVAAADPQAAYHAVTNSYPVEQVRRTSVLSDGATRPVDQMRLYGWPEYLDLLDKLGPELLIRHVREIENRDPDARRYPRTKRHDDATVAQYVAGAGC